MGGESPLCHHLVHLGVVIACVQTQVLGPRLRHPRALHWQGPHRRPHQLPSRAMGSRHHHAQGDAAPVRPQTAFGAALGAVGRIGPGPFFPPKGPWASYGKRPACHSWAKTPARCHSWKRSWTVLPAPKLRGKAFHWQPVRST
jgi:hypothetical protein